MMRNKSIQVIIISLLVLFLLNAGAVFAQKKTVKQNVKAKTETEQKKPEEDLTEFKRPDFNYNSSGKRDPFDSLAPVTERELSAKPIKELFNYEESLLKGIVKTEEDVYALVTDADGYSYVLRKGYSVFGGFVTDITEDALVLHIVKYARSMTIILRLASSNSSIIEEIGADASLLKKPGITLKYSKSAMGDEARPTVQIRDVVLPSLGVKTVDETWFVEGASGTVDKKSIDTSNDSFSLITPPNGGELSLPFEMNWSDLKGDAVTYTITISDVADFSSPLYLKGGIDISSYVLEDSAHLPVNKILYWKVTAKNGDGGNVLCRQTSLSFMIR